MAIVEEVKSIVRLLMMRPITEAVALQIGATDGFEGLEVEDGAWVGFDEDEYTSGEEHGWLETLILTRLTNWALTNRAGRVYPGDTNFVMDGTPDDIGLKRRPDEAYVRDVNVQASKGYIYAAPDLAVGVISPTERPAQIRKKLHEYLEHGVSQVWQVYPDTREIVVHFPDGSAKTYRAGEVLQGGDLLPGFSLDVAELFDRL